MQVDVPAPSQIFGQLAFDAGAAKLHRKLHPLFKALFIEPNPVPVKTAMVRAGIIGSAEVRLPLCEMSAANLKILTGVLTALGK